MNDILDDIKIKLILYREIMVLGDFGYLVTLPMQPNDRRAVQNGRPDQGGVPDTSATCFQKPVFRAWLARRRLVKASSLSNAP